MMIDSLLQDAQLAERRQLIQDLLPKLDPGITRSPCHPVTLSSFHRDQTRPGGHGGLNSAKDPPRLVTRGTSRPKWTGAELNRRHLDFQWRLRKAPRFARTGLGIQCALTGQRGYCQSGPTLSFSGSDQSPHNPDRPRQRPRVGV